MKSTANEYQCLFHGGKSDPGHQVTEGSANTYKALNPIMARRAAGFELREIRNRPGPSSWNQCSQLYPGRERSAFMYWANGE
jgi:hypothetical protein